MIVAAMQPYFFPYIGYFQLIHAADVFIFLDDVQYIQRGWVNRNRIRHGDRWIWLTHAVESADRDLAIVDRQYVKNGINSAARLMGKIEENYRNSSNFDQCSDLIRRLIENEESNVCLYNCQHVSALCNEFGIETNILKSSEVKGKGELRGQERIIDLCKTLGASTYINPIGGLNLYQTSEFDEAGLKLNFLRSTYPLTNLSPEPSYLSIIDTLMMDSIENVRLSLNSYEIIHPQR